MPSNWRLDVDIVADNRVFISGMGMESEWSANIHVGGTSGSPSITGGIDLVRGNLDFAGRSFEMQSGRIRFSEGNPYNPTLAVTASGEADDVTVVDQPSGSANNPRVTFSSTPALPQDEVLARILFGSSIGQLSTIQAVQLASSLNALRGGSGGLNPLGVLQSAAGIDRLRILGSDENAGRGTAVAVGKYITNDIYVEIVTDARGYTATPDRDKPDARALGAEPGRGVSGDPMSTSATARITRPAAAAGPRAGRMQRPGFRPALHRQGKAARERKRGDAERARPADDRETGD